MLVCPRRRPRTLLRLGTSERRISSLARTRIRLLHHHHHQTRLHQRISLVKTRTARLLPRLRLMDPVTSRSRPVRPRMAKTAKHPHHLLLTVFATSRSRLVRTRTVRTARPLLLLLLLLHHQTVLVMSRLKPVKTTTARLLPRRLPTARGISRRTLRLARTRMARTAKHPLLLYHPTVLVTSKKTLRLARTIRTARLLLPRLPTAPGMSSRTLRLAKTPTAKRPLPLPLPRAPHQMPTKATRPGIFMTRL